jgi:hypothetical protein
MRDKRVFLKALTPKIAAKAMQTFDRAMTVVVGSCWAAAILMMAFALYTLTLVVSAKHASDVALMAEPKVPKVVHKTIDSATAQGVVDRLQRRFPDINFSLQNNMVKVMAQDGAKFRQWLTAVSYVDTISPGINWTIQELCVGKCSNNQLMRVTLVGDSVSFQAAGKD